LLPGRSWKVLAAFFGAFDIFLEPLRGEKAHGSTVRILEFIKAGVIGEILFFACLPQSLAGLGIGNFDTKRQAVMQSHLLVE
jgi:hypothetical protein